MQDEWFKYVIFPLVAGFGAMVTYAKRAVSRKAFSKMEFTVEAASATFVGLMITLGGDALGLSAHWLGMAAGMSGWMGGDFVRSVLTQVVRNKVGSIEFQDTIENSYKGPNRD